MTQHKKIEKRIIESNPSGEYIYNFISPPFFGPSLWVLLDPLDNLLPTVGIYNLFCAKLWNFVFVNSMIFGEKSPRFEKGKSRKTAKFLYMAQVGNKKYIKMSNREFKN
jgi:hypothetical protein